MNPPSILLAAIASVLLAGCHSGNTLRLAAESAATAPAECGPVSVTSSSLRGRNGYFFIRTDLVFSGLDRDAPASGVRFRSASYESDVLTFEPAGVGVLPYNSEAPFDSTVTVPSGRFYVVSEPEQTGSAVADHSRWKTIRLVVEWTQPQRSVGDCRSTFLLAADPYFD